MSSKKEKIASVGVAAKGVVYALLSILTLLSVFNLGGQKSGSKDALQFISEQSYGTILLAIIGIGLACYVLYRLYEVFIGSEADDESKDVIKRIGYFISAAIYGFLCYYTFSIIAGSSSGQSSQSSMGSGNSFLAWAIAIGLLIKGGYDIYKAYSKKYKEDIQSTDLDAKHQSTLLTWSRLGITARGVVFIIMAYLSIKSGGEIFQGKTDVFTYIQQEFGKIALILVTLGLLGYGIFMFIKARYASLTA